MTYSAEQAAELLRRQGDFVLAATFSEEISDVINAALEQQAAPGVAGELCRRQFEIYAASQGHKDFEQNEFGNYKNPAVQGDYWIWIASREAMASQNGAGEFCTVINDDKSKCQRENRHCGYPSCIASQPHPTGDTQQKAVRPKFPTMLRKMWSGGEVQDWLDKHDIFTHPPAAIALAQEVRDRVVEIVRKRIGHRLADEISAIPIPEPRPDALVAMAYLKAAEVCKKRHGPVHEILSLIPPDAQAALEELERDAKRYRWLRSEHDPADLPIAQVVWKRSRQESDWFNIIDGSDLDAHIDAEIGAADGA